MKTYWKTRVYNILTNCVILRLHIYQSLKNVYIQIIDDNKGLVILSSSTLDVNVRKANLNNSRYTNINLICNILGHNLKRYQISKLIFDSNRVKNSKKINTIVSNLESLSIKIN